MDERVLAALKLIAAAKVFGQHVKTSGLKADLDHLIEQLQPELPAKPDGTPWTDEEIHAAAAAARAPWEAVRGRDVE